MGRGVVSGRVGVASHENASSFGRLGKEGEGLAAMMVVRNVTGIKGVDENRATW